MVLILNVLSVSGGNMLKWMGFDDGDYHKEVLVFGCFDARLTSAVPLSKKSVAS